jgi:hypothetical protein
MRCKLFVGAACLVVLLPFGHTVVGFPAAPPKVEAAPAPAQPTAPEFKEYLGIWLKGTPDKQVVLQGAKFKRLGNHDFIVGTPVTFTLDDRPRTPRDDSPREFKVHAHAKIVLWIPLAEVLEMYEFEDGTGYLPKK